MVKSVRFGIVGVGRRGSALLKAILKLPTASVEAVCDPDKERLSSCSLTYGVKGYLSLEDMLKRGSLDAVVVASPTPFHVHQTEICLKLGLDVLMEKPISLSLAESKRLLKLVEMSSQIVAVGFQMRYSNLADRLVESIDPETLSMIMGFWYWTTPLVGWIRRRNMAGGQMVDQAIHLLDLYRMVAGEVEEVYAVYTERGRGLEEDKKIGFENWTSYVAVLRFKSGAVGCLGATYALYPRLFKPPLGGGYRVGLDIVCRERLVRYIHGLEVRVYLKGADVKIYRLEEDPTEKMVEAFVEAVITRDKSVLKTPYEDSFRSNALALAANESAKRGEPINLCEFLENEQVEQPPDRSS